jgi:hypothetical protein
MVDSEAARSRECAAASGTCDAYPDFVNRLGGCDLRVHGADGIELAGVAADLQRMNDGRFFSPVWNDYHFPAEDRMLVLQWDAVQTLEASKRFTAQREDGIERTHAQDFTFAKAAYGETYTFVRLVREDLQGLFIH